MLNTLGYVDTLEVDREGQRVVLEFAPKISHMNADDVVQGGIITGWLDAAMASAVFAARGRGTTLSSLEIKTSYLAPVPLGETVKVEGWVVRSGKRTAFMEGRVNNQSGQTLATASSTASVRTRTPEA